MIASLGGAGMGLVWGWAVVLLSGRGRAKRLLVNLLLLTLATLLVSLQVFWFTGWRGLAPFLGAGAFATFIHLAWREDMRRRTSSRSRPS